MSPEDAVESLSALPPWAGVVAVAGLAALENLFPVLPADVFVLAAAVLAARSGTDPLLLGIAAALSNAAGALGVYAAARTGGPAFLAGRMGRALLRPRQIAFLERVGRRHGWWAVGMARLLPGVRALVPVVAGLARVPPLPVMLPTLAISSAWYGIIAWLGGRAGTHLSDAVEFMARVGGFLTALAALATAVLAWSWWRSRRESGPGARPSGPEGT